MAEKQQKVSIRIPTDIDTLGRAVLAEMIIDFIQDRTQKGKDINNGNFTQYSTAYKDSRDFSTAGKTGLVNLELTGDMMNSIELISSIQGVLTIGFAAGTDENDKAAWVSDFSGGPSRRFLGISAEDLRTVIARFRETNPEQQSTVSSEARSIFNRILGNG